MIKKILNKIFHTSSIAGTGSERKTAPENEELIDDESDLGIAKSQLSWFFHGKKIKNIRNGQLEPNLEFQKIFPQTNKLLEKANITAFEIDNKAYRLYGWITKSENSCGWLCKLEDRLGDNNFLKDHKVLIEHMGGIQESWDEYDEIEVNNPFTLNQNFMFIGSECWKGLGKLEKVYLELCEKEKLSPLKNYKELIVFAKEVNGDLTLYDLETKKVYLYAHDQASDYAEILEGQPKYTFYNIIGIESFTDYVEKLSNDWLGIII